MTILYASPVFSDYRIPFYNKLNELFNVLSIEIRNGRTQ